SGALGRGEPDARRLSPRGAHADRGQPRLRLRRLSGAARAAPPAGRQHERRRAADGRARPRPDVGADLPPDRRALGRARTDPGQPGDRQDQGAEGAPRPDHSDGRAELQPGDQDRRSRLRHGPRPHRVRRQHRRARRQFDDQALLPGRLDDPSRARHDPAMAGRPGTPLLHRPDSLARQPAEAMCTSSNQWPRSVSCAMPYDHAATVRVARVLRSSLMVGVAILLLGNGLIGSLLGVRAGIEAFPTVAVGIIMSCYYLGYIGGAHLGPAFISRVGHIRTFAALAAIAATTAGLHAMFVHPVTWGVLRLITGLCFAGLYVVLESWINGRSTNATRGLLLSVYMFVSYAGLALGQQLLNLYDPAGFELFILSSTLISLSLVPFALTRRAAPEVPAMAGLDLRRVYEISPLGIIGCFAVGVGNGAFWGLGPLFAQGI